MWRAAVIRASRTAVAIAGVMLRGVGGNRNGRECLSSQIPRRTRYFTLNWATNDFIAVVFITYGLHWWGGGAASPY